MYTNKICQVMWCTDTTPIFEVTNGVILQIEEK